MNFNSQFSRYADVITALPDHFNTVDPLPAELKMTGNPTHEVYYAPFDHVTRSARIVLVGITPGQSQAKEAISVARRLLRGGKPNHDQVLAEAKKSASFAGPMRRNLVDLLDYIGVSKQLGISSTATLWGEHSELVHFTSALRYPVFDKGKNYGGQGITRSHFLLDQIDTWFASECAGLPNALFVPLGDAAASACVHLSKEGVLKEKQILRGLPHPSGANAERIAYFLGRKPKERLSPKTRPEQLDSNRDIARNCVKGWWQ